MPTFIKKSVSKPIEDSRVYVGIDPGVNGAIAVLYKDLVMLHKMPSTHRAIYLLLLSITMTEGLPNTRCVIEEVGGYIPKRTKEGGKAEGQPGSRMFVFGEVYGGLLMALAALGYEEGKTFHKCRPQTWQRTLQIKPCDHKNGETKPKFKRRLVDIARVTFPREKVIGQVADSLLIAQYCKFITQTPNKVV